MMKNIIANLISLYIAFVGLETVMVSYGEDEPKDVGETPLVEDGGFTHNLRLMALVLGVTVEAIVSPFKFVIPWVLTGDSEIIETLKSVTIAAAVWNGKKKAYVEKVFRLSWLADENGLPTDLRSASIVELQNVEVAQPAIFLGHIEKVNGGNSKKNLAAVRQQCWRFFFSGGLISNLDPFQMALAKALVGGETPLVESDSQINWVPNLIVGHENVQLHIDDFCAPPNKEAQLAAALRKKDGQLASQAAAITAIEAQRAADNAAHAAEMAALQAQIAEMMAMMKNQSS